MLTKLNNLLNFEVNHYQSKTNAMGSTEQVFLFSDLVTALNVKPSTLRYQIKKCGEVKKNSAGFYDLTDLEYLKKLNQFLSVSKGNTIKEFVEANASS